MTSAACTALVSRRPFLGCCCRYLDGESVEATILRVHGADYDVAVTRIDLPAVTPRFGTLAVVRAMEPAPD
jgi:hypothetical protein